MRDSRLAKLSRLGVRDSKLLTARRRRFLYEEISSAAEEVKVYRIANSEINEAMQRKISLNELEAIHFARLLDSIAVDLDKVYFDSPDVISERFGIRISLLSSKPMRIDGVKTKMAKEEKEDKGKEAAHSSRKRIRVVSEHKADVRYPIVSCASIIAKVTRDKEIESLQDRIGIDIGSGYPSDKTTIDAIRASLGTNKLVPYIRTYWKTLNVVRQLKMSDFPVE